MNVGATDDSPAFALARDLTVDALPDLVPYGSFSVSVFDEIIQVLMPDDWFGAFALE